MAGRDISDPGYYRELAHKLLTGNITEDERRELEEWYNAGQDEPVYIPASFTGSESELERRLLMQIRQMAGLEPEDQTRRRTYRLFKSWWAAAAVLLIMLAGGYFLLTPSEKDDSVALAESNGIKNDIQPGGNKAILTLADGTNIVLDSADNGNLSKEGNVTVIKLDNGQLAYQLSTLNSELSTVLYNTVTTPRGGQYQLILQDGSKVWLNAESSLRYPTSFDGDERKVELTGEGYFEVARNERMPFYVTVGDMNVKVLGTHFNINAYRDEGAIKTTLLEGKVEVSTSANSAFLVPGDQVSCKDNVVGSKIKGINLEQVISWKDESFDFTNETLANIARRLSRWYNVEIVIDKGIADKRLSGIVSMKNNLSKVLQVLEISADIQSKIEGEKVFFYKY